MQTDRCIPSLDTVHLCSIDDVNGFVVWKRCAVVTEPIGRSVKCCFVVLTSQASTKWQKWTELNWTELTVLTYYFTDVYVQSDRNELNWTELTVLNWTDSLDVLLHIRVCTKWQKWTELNWTDSLDVLLHIRVCTKWQKWTELNWTDSLDILLHIRVCTKWQKWTELNWTDSLDILLHIRVCTKWQKWTELTVLTYCSWAHLVCVVNYCRQNCTELNWNLSSVELSWGQLSSNQTVAKRSKSSVLQQKCRCMCVRVRVCVCVCVI